MQTFQTMGELAMLVDFGILSMLSVQSWLLYKLLPEVKKVSGNTDIVKRLFGRPP